MVLGRQRPRGDYILRTPVVRLEVCGTICSSRFHVLLLI
jgi:hypothetical protein